MRVGVCIYMYMCIHRCIAYIYSDNFGECSRIEERELFILGYSSSTPLGGSSTVCERNVLASNVFRLRCDSRRSFRRAIRGEFLDAAMFLSTRCFSRTFSRFGSEAGQFFSRLLVGHCHTERERGVGNSRKGGGERKRGGERNADLKVQERDTRRPPPSRARVHSDRFASLARIIIGLLLALCIPREKKPADVKGGKVTHKRSPPHATTIKY